MRHKDWDQRLWRYNKGLINKPYAWGSFDCVMYASGAVEAQNGTDFAAEWRGTYDTKLGALRIMATLGVENVAGLADRYLPTTPPELAGRGDIGAFPTEDGLALGVVEGRFIIGPTSYGLIQWPKSCATHFWKV